MENFSPNVRQLRGMDKGREKSGEHSLFLFIFFNFPTWETLLSHKQIKHHCFFEAQNCNYAYSHTALRKAELTL